MQSPPADLRVDTQMAAASDGAALTFDGELGTAWNFHYPCGGVHVAMALRAASAALADPHLALASTTATFCAPLHPGPVRATVEILRRGQAASQVRVRLRNRYAPEHRERASEGLELLATFARARQGPDVLGLAAPPVTAFADSTDARDGHPANPYDRWAFYANLDVRLAEGPRGWQPDAVAGPARYARWFRYRHVPRGPSGTIERYALPPIVDSMPGALLAAIGPSTYRFNAPSLDLTMQVIDDTDDEWLLVAVAVPRARAGLGLGTCQVWDRAGRLVAIGSQAMHLSTLAGEPPTVDARHR
jgi:acyl-CoA thioesterase